MNSADKDLVIAALNLAIETSYSETNNEKFQAALRVLKAQNTEHSPALVVRREPDYWSGGHFHEGKKPFIDPFEVYKLPIGTKLFTGPVIPTGIRLADIGFRFDADNQQHIPQLIVEFEPVPVNSPNTHKGWDDRDNLARALGLWKK